MQYMVLLLPVAVLVLAQQWKGISYLQKVGGLIPLQDELITLEYFTRRRLVTYKQK
jgi:hypothetical protein